MKFFLALQIALAALVTAQDEDVSAYCTRTLPGTISLTVVPTVPVVSTARLPPLRLMSTDTAGVSSLVVCSDCGLPALTWALTGGVLRAATTASSTVAAAAYYNLFVEANTSPSFAISGFVPPPQFPIYCAVPDAVGSKTGYLALRGTTKEFYTCDNLIPTFAPTDRKDVFWRVNPKNATYPRGDCKKANILYKLV
ncbi:hypothetical protein FS842_001831 [Serendipita sp. 407]|nr:hypothetical protein FRC16_003893 [Serendipita sp. 398]KAG9043384.1 hypothetical protein FS842_001831 [Serendipita sp. 407]